MKIEFNLRISTADNDDSAYTNWQIALFRGFGMLLTIVGAVLLVLSWAAVLQAAASAKPWTRSDIGAMAMLSLASLITVGSFTILRSSTTQLQQEKAVGWTIGPVSRRVGGWSAVVIAAGYLLASGLAIFRAAPAVSFDASSHCVLLGALGVATLAWGLNFLNK